MRFSLPLLMLLAVQLTSAGDNWPEFRGPRADGIGTSHGLPTTWSETENIVWKTAIPGEGYSSPVIWGEQIWLTSASPDGKQLFAWCIDRDSGELIHERLLFEVANPREKHKFNTYASPTPAIEEGRVHLSWGSSGIACLDTRSADLVWSRRDLECNHYRGPGSSFVLWNDLLISHFDGFDYQYVIALDKHTGDTVWKTPRPTDFGTDDGDKKKAYATPIVIDVDGRSQLISPTSMGTFAYDVRTGEEIWHVTHPEFSSANRPIYANGLLYIGTGFGKGAVMAVKPTGQGDVTETHVVWVEKRNMPSKPSPLLVDGLLYCISDTGVATCLDSATGESVWQGGWEATTRHPLSMPTVTSTSPAKRGRRRSSPRDASTPCSRRTCSMMAVSHHQRSSTEHSSCGRARICIALRT